MPIGFLGGIYLAEFGGGAFAFIVRYTTDLLNGVPSIVIGIFAYTLVVLPMHHFSTLAGGVALGIMMIPIALRSTEEFLRAVPNPCAKAPGARRQQMEDIVTVVVPAACTGILTGSCSTSRASPEKPPRFSSPPSATSSGAPAGSSPPRRSRL